MWFGVQGIGNGRRPRRDCPWESRSVTRRTLCRPPPSQEWLTRGTLTSTLRGAVTSTTHRAATGYEPLETRTGTSYGPRQGWPWESRSVTRRTLGRSPPSAEPRTPISAPEPPTVTHHLPSFRTVTSHLALFRNHHLALFRTFK